MCVLTGETRRLGLPDLLTELVYLCYAGTLDIVRRDDICELICGQLGWHEFRQNIHTVSLGLVRCLRVIEFAPELGKEVKKAESLLEVFA